MKRWILATLLLAAGCNAAPGIRKEQAVATPAIERLAPSYVLSDGFDLVARLDFQDDGTFRFSWQGCAGVIAQASGRYEAAADSVRLSAAPGEFRQDPRTFAERLHRIHWGDREYLVPEERMLAFANAINAGREPRSHVIGGVFYLRSGDESRAVAGLPSLPGQWQRFLLAKPLAGTVAKVVQKETHAQRPIVIIDSGSAAGLREGMTLVAVNPRRPHFRADLTILSVEPETAKAEVDFQYNHVRVCDVWKSRASRKATQQTDAADEALLSACLVQRPRS
jgi:hypothetical protein